MQTKIAEKYFFWGLLLATIFLTFTILQPFLIVLVLGISFSVVLYPVYEWFEKKGWPKSLSSFVTLLLFIVVLCGPLLVVGTVVFRQGQNVYQTFTDKETAGPLIARIETNVNNILPSEMALDINKEISDFFSFIEKHITNIFNTTVATLFSFILILLIIFHVLKNGTEWRKAMIALSPLPDKEDEKIISRLASAINGIIKGNLLIALIQGGLLGLGLWIFGVSNAVLWGLVAAVTSLVPTFGTSLVSIPAVIFLFLTGHTTSAIGLLLWAGIMVGMIDNFLGPIIVGNRINIPSILILFSVLGGIALFGPVGILMGPLTISLLYALVSIYTNEFKQNKIL